MFEPIRGGTRGGQAEFKWADVSADKDRENYLGHSINAPTGRWQKNKDVHWYNRDAKSDKEEERLAEIKRIKEAEAEALSIALGFAPSQKDKVSGASSDPVPPSSSGIGSAMKPDQAEVERALEKEERRLRKAQRKEEKRARKEKHRAEKASRHGSDDEGDNRSRRRDRSRSRSPALRQRTREREMDRARTPRYSRSRSRSRTPRRTPPPRDRALEYDSEERERERERDRRRWNLNARREMPRNHRPDR